jgi:acetyl esterase/lipase
VFFQPWLPRKLTNRQESAHSDQRKDDKLQAEIRHIVDQAPPLTPAQCHRLAVLLAGRDPKSTPLASPLYADLNDLPPLLVLVGEREGLYDDAQRLAEKVRAASGDVELEVAEGQFHIFPVFDFLPEARAATDRIGSFLGTRFFPRPTQALP